MKPVFKITNSRIKFNNYHFQCANSLSHTFKYAIVRAFNKKKHFTPIPKPILAGFPISYYYV